MQRIRAVAFICCEKRFGVGVRSKAIKGEGHLGAGDRIHISHVNPR